VDETDLTNVVDAWIAGESADRGSPEYETNWWAISEVSDWSFERNGELLWRFILAAYKRNLPDKVIAVLAAGPIEDLLAKEGPDFIDRVETLARQDPKFNYLLGGVWRNTMTDDVWERVTAIRNHVW
jgi:hypothetical protein